MNNTTGSVSGPGELVSGPCRAGVQCLQTPAQVQTPAPTSHGVAGEHDTTSLGLGFPIWRAGFSQRGWG